MKKTNFTPPQPLKTAVLFLVFNRIDTTKQVFAAIKKAKPPRLYIAADGYRENVPDEDLKVQAVREYVMNEIDWDCEVKTLFRDKNIGCRHTVSGAITWFFENEEMGIILEDDCLPSQSFFWFCEELLEKYRYDNRIVQVSGNNFQNGILRTQDSYYFSKHTHIWGWATWRRAWQHYDKDMALWDKHRVDFLLKQTGAAWKPFVRYWGRLFEKVKMGQIDTWAYIWQFSCWTSGGFVVIPEVNLVRNIGFGPSATHTKGQPRKRAPFTRHEEIQFPLKHPIFFISCFEADRYVDKKHFSIRPIVLNKTLWFLKIPIVVLRKMKSYFLAEVFL